jgi:NADH dehydrogenase
VPTESQLDVVTGAFGYIGKRITGMLLAKGRRVRTLTGHPRRNNPFGASVTVERYAFDDPPALAKSLAGARTLYNTYWIRYERGQTTFARAVRNSRALLDAARDAAVRRVVHISITKPEEGAEHRLPYFLGKLEVERAVVGSEPELSWAIVRPTVVFGEDDILVNNIAWMLRRFPVFAIPGDGSYEVRPVAVEDVARLAVEAGEADDKRIVDAVGPDAYSFEDMVKLIRTAVRSRSRLVHVPPEVALAMSRAIGPLVRDRVITTDELEGLRRELVVTEGEATGETRFVDWLAEAGPGLGRRYHSELTRHYR